MVEIWETLSIKVTVPFFLPGAMTYLFFVGFISILGQVVLLRELNVAFYGIELIYTLALGIWLLCSACGALIAQKIQNPSFLRINLLFFLLFFCIPLDVAFIRSIRILFTGTSGAYLPLASQIAAMSAALLPIGLLLGLLFQWTAQAYMKNGKSLAAAYAIECVGGLAGGIGSTLFLKFGFQNFTIGIICACFALGASFLKVGTKKSRWFYALIAAVIAALLFWKAPEFDRVMTSWTHPNLSETKDTPYSRITITHSAGQTSIFENDALAFDTEGTQAEELVHLAALQHPNPQKILILGGGVEGIVREALLHSPASIDYVELNRSLLKIAPRHLPFEIQQSLQSDKVQIIIEDPRRFLSGASLYDLILVGMPEPSSGQANRFYTLEFFQQCVKKLNRGGILAFRLQSSENVWTPLLTRRMVSIYSAAKSVFPEISFIPGSVNVVVCSLGMLITDPSLLAARLESRKIKANLITPRYLNYLYANDRFLEIGGILRAGSAPINTDARPICYQYTIMIWLSKFIPSMNFADFPHITFSIGRGILLLLVLGLLMLALRFVRWSIRRALLTGIAAYAGMALETCLLLHFQTKSGILYQDIGILLTSFMAGLALGAIAVAKMRLPLPKRTGAAILLGFALLSAIIAWEIHSGRGASLLPASGLLLLVGIFVAAVFSYASLYAADDQKKIIAPLYAADLIGGCIGALITSLLLVPLAGLAASAWLMMPAVLLFALLL
jgi:spermidine synthase